MLKNAPSHFIEAIDTSDLSKLIIGNSCHNTDMLKWEKLSYSLKSTKAKRTLKTVALFKIYLTTTPLADRLKQYPSC